MRKKILDNNTYTYLYEYQQFLSII